jgi:thiol-disulfide isomerase/thioredoxin
MSRTLRTVAMSLLAGMLVAPPARADEPVSAFHGFDAGSLVAIREANVGKAFVLAFWSIHCAPCIEDMGEWRILKKKYPDVPILLVTTDPPAERAKAARVLSQFQLGRVETWAFADEFTERVRFSVDRSWRGELPRTYFYDAAHRPQVRSGRIDMRWSDAWFAQQVAARNK